MCWNYKSSVKAPCGVDGCATRFDTRVEWVKHCQVMHPDFYYAELGKCASCSITECSTRNSKDECLADKEKTESGQ